MKNIQDILKRKTSREAKGVKKYLDEKTISRVFLEAAKAEIKSLEDADIREMNLKEQTLYIKTAHPVVSSELFLRKEQILEEANKIAGTRVIEKIII